MSLEKIVNMIQQNRYFNATKTAVIKVAYIQLALAAVIFVVYQFMLYGTINPNIQQGLVLFYQVYCILIGVIFTYVTLEELVEHHENHLIYSGVFISTILALVFYANNIIMEYTVYSLLFSVLIYIGLHQFSKLKIEVKSFPLAVNDYLNRLIPTLLMFMLVLILAYFGHRYVGYLAQGLIWLTYFISGPIFVLLTIIAICSFWILGVHGVGVIGTILRPFWFYMMLVNAYLALQGQPAVYIGSETFFQWAVWLGGSGATFGLAFASKFLAKSQHLKSIGKDTFHSSIFNINETVIFGTPIVGNKLFSIPFFLAPIIAAVIGYSAFAYGYVRTPAIVAPWVFPVPLGIFISTLGDWRSIILGLMLLASTLLVYYPFFYKYDQQLLEQEKENEN
ncbi:PTS transporter subunit EIIC [Erysipelothrix urinaevulpis]|uniref:PTS transporter subunit EIIC n=1 Tax=Erysipelothrix urinaevulpis TaxID=2683717 RepID=UPI00135B9595|nr:PTS transporter subunit EIIC [Erysipelothrix urinaevulpis]